MKKVLIVFAIISMAHSAFADSIEFTIGDKTFVQTTSYVEDCFGGFSKVDELYYNNTKLDLGNSRMIQSQFEIVNVAIENVSGVNDVLVVEGVGSFGSITMYFVYLLDGYKRISL